MEQELYEIMRAYCDDFQEKRKNYPSLVVNNSIPIVWFGDLEKYQASPVKIVTVGLNPSWHEFLEKNGTPLRIKRFREIDFSSPVNNIVNELYSTLNEYFRINPYWEYFMQYEKLLRGIGASFCWAGSENIALHIDAYTSIATNSLWRDLSYSAQWGFKADGMELYPKLIKYLCPDVLLISVAQNDFDVLYPNLKPFQEYNDPNKKGVYVRAYRNTANGKGQRIISARNFHGTPFGGRSTVETIQILKQILGDTRGDK